jgi:hypothetical protein
MKRQSLIARSISLTLLACGVIAIGGWSQSAADSFFKREGWLAITYVAPVGEHAQLKVNAPDRTSTPLFVEVCSAGKWKKAALLGPGLLRAGGVVYADDLGVRPNPKAIPLPDHDQFEIPAGGITKFRIRSHNELVSGSVLGPHTISSCTVPIVIEPRSGEAYSVTWYRHSDSCDVRLFRVGDTVTQTEEELPLRTADPSC